MTVDQLREFLVLAEIGNYQRAADILYISQATLSRHIIRLEQELNVALFDRAAHANKLSSAGKKFLPHAKEIVALNDACYQRIQKKLHNEEGDLSIAVLHNFHYYGVADMLAAFARTHPHISISVTETSSSEMRQMTIDGQCAFAFVSEMGAIESDTFLHEQFFTDVLAVCLPISHRLARSEYVTFEQLEGETFIMAHQSGRLYDTCVLACRRSGFEPRIVHSVSGNSIYHFVGNDLGISILLKTPAVQAHMENTCIVDLWPPVRTAVNMIYLKRPLDPKEACFLSFVKACIAEREKSGDSGQKSCG